MVENPLASKVLITAFTASLSPAITVIFGEFLLAAITYPSAELSTFSTSTYGAVTLAINPLSSICTEPISVPLAADARSAPSIFKIPEDINAAYSPSEWPATISGVCPWALSNRSMAKSAVNIAG